MGDPDRPGQMLLSVQPFIINPVHIFDCGSFVVTALPAANCTLMIFIIRVGAVHGNCCVFIVHDGYAAVRAYFTDPAVAGNGMVIVVSRFGSAFSRAFVPEAAGYFRMFMGTGVRVAALHADPVRVGMRVRFSMVFVQYRIQAHTTVFADIIPVSRTAYLMGPVVAFQFRKHRISGPLIGGI